jgi:hypothetical protein
MTISLLKNVAGTLALGLLPAIAGRAATIPDPISVNYPRDYTPSVTAFGRDDWNTSTLNPYGVSYLTPGSPDLMVGDSTWIQLAQRGSPFAGWIFGFADGKSANLIPNTDLKVNIYSAWVVINDPVTALDGIPHARPMHDEQTKADAGGADFELTYTPNAMLFLSPTDPTPVHFLQIVRTRSCISRDDLTCEWTDYSYRFDNLGRDTPFYDVVSSFKGTIKGTNSQWMFDNPYSCEDPGSDRRGVHESSSMNCISPSDKPADGGTLKEEKQFQTFVATYSDNNILGVPDVTLYGGVEWGYIYTNQDRQRLSSAPEPGGFALASLRIGVLALLIARVRSGFVFLRGCHLPGEPWT